MARDPKRIAREWNREIEVEMRRRRAHQENGPWRIVVWMTLAALWFIALFAALGFLERLLR